MSTENWIDLGKILLTVIATFFVTGGSGVLFFRHQMQKLKEEILNTAANTKKTEAEKEKEKADTAAIYQEIAEKEAGNALKKSDMITNMSLQILTLTKDVAYLTSELDKEKKERLAAASELQSLKLLSGEHSAKQEKEIIKLKKRVKDLEDILRQNNLPIPLEVVE